MRTLKILAVVLVALLLGAAAAWFWIRHAADRKWAAAEERILRLSAEHPVVVPPMPSTPASKEIQIHFVAAIRTAVKRSVRHPNLVELQENMGTEAVQDAIADAQEFLERLHQGARQCAASPTDFPPGWRGEWDTSTIRHMIECCVLRARQLREQSRPFNGAETLLDALQLGRFWAASGRGDHARINALHALETPCGELLLLVSKETLTREQLVLMDRELEPLDQALPSPVDALDSALARFGESLAEWKEPLRGHVPYRWRYVLPFPLMKAQGFEFADHAVERLRADGSASYPNLLQAMREIDLECSRSRNPIIADGFWFADPSYWVALHRMAQFRLLRAGTRYRAAGEFLALKDPFGETLRHSRTETRMKFWSFGKDGVDHGGDKERDLVIEVDHPRPE